MKYFRRIAIVVLVLLTALFIAGELCQMFYFKKPKPFDPASVENPDSYRYQPVKTLAAHIALTEKPTATRVLLADEGGEVYREFFENVGIKCLAQESSRRYDIVIVTGKGERDWASLSKRITDTGVIAWPIDVRGVTTGDFKMMLSEFPGEQVHLWMISESDWMLVGRKKECVVKLGAILDSFTREGAFYDLARANCDSLGELFASYVGIREDIMPAFTGDMSVLVRPEFFVTDTVLPIEWIDIADVDKDISDAISSAILSARETRLLVVRGGMCSRDPALARNGEFISLWAEAAKRNPHDPMLLERLYQLAINARAFRGVGNIKGAARCFETMVAIRPGDIAAVKSYAECMRMLGETAVAEQIMDKVKEMENGQ